MNNRKKHGQSFIQIVLLKNGKTKRIVHYKDSALKRQRLHFNFMEKHFNL